MTEYQKNLVRVWDSLRTENKGSYSCNLVECAECPFYKTVCSNMKLGILFNAEKAIEIVNDWAKEHPIVTMADKYKEVFGVEPKNERGEYVCPAWAGFGLDICDKNAICSKGCNENFWNSEYKEPKKEGES